jgi:6-pyruvoyltetrahydropterin/6-carboxytetrahydropterin synthase
MRFARISKTVTFEAAHQLPHHAGKCARLHGHSYRAELVLEGEVREADGSSGEGMVIDFSEVKAAWQLVHRNLDHAFLNDVLPPEYLPTTAENIAAYLLDVLSVPLPQLVGVRLWETATSCAEVTA